MKIFPLFCLLLFVLVFSGCRKDKVDLQQILTSTSWEEIDGVYNGKLNSFKSLYKVTFNTNGEFEIIYRSWGVNSTDSISRDTTKRALGFDNISGKYSFLNSGNTIVFKPYKIKVVLTDSASIFYGCDSIQYFIADWQIRKLGSHILETHGLNPDTTNHSNCIMIQFLNDFNFRPFE